jgi:hypothetical protein
MDVAHEVTYCDCVGPPDTCTGRCKPPVSELSGQPAAHHEYAFLAETEHHGLAAASRRDGAGGP